MARSELTEFGFVFGSIEVTRTASLPDGRAIITVKSDAGRKIDIYASSTGRSVRVFEDGKELT
jgi:hypothetical protein